ncbi:hypothetical protein LL963_10175 [Xanthomonas campestris pv. esculenti]|nr:hypothetical protein [Xanthomonas campestris pv. esculenti]
MSDSDNDWLVRVSNTQRRIREGAEELMSLDEYRKLRAERKRLAEENVEVGKSSEAKPKKPIP